MNDPAQHERGLEARKSASAPTLDMDPSRTSLRQHVWDEAQFRLLCGDVFPGEDPSKGRNPKLERRIWQWKSSCARLDFRSLTILNLEKAFNADGTATKDHIRLVCELTSLEVLNLKRNHLTEFDLSPRLAQLCHLKTLDISYNSITRIPHFILVHNKQLRKLDVTYNQLRDLPATLLRLPNLETVYRMGNGSMARNYDYFENDLNNRLHPWKLNNSANDSLSTLALRTAIAHGKLGSLPFLPQLIAEDVEHVALNMCICDHCLRVNHSVGFRFMLYPRRFCGLCYVPFFAQTCSMECGQGLFDRWDWTKTRSESDDECEEIKPRCDLIKPKKRRGKTGQWCCVQ